MKRIYNELMNLESALQENKKICDFANAITNYYFNDETDDIDYNEFSSVYSFFKKELYYNTKRLDDTYERLFKAYANELKGVLAHDKNENIIQNA